MKNKIIVITGGATGIGYALIQALHQDNTIISLDRKPEKIARLKKALPNVCSILADINNEEQINAALNQIEEYFGKIDLLIHNAGTGGNIDFVTMPLQDLKDKLTQEVYTDFLSPIFLTKTAMPLLRKSSSPQVVFVTSGLAYMPVAIFPGYCAAKAAMHSFALSLQKQMAGTKIKIVEVLPPTVDTDFSKGIDAPKISPQEFVRKFLQKLKQDHQVINVGQSASLNVFSRLFPKLAFKMLNRQS